MVLLSQAQASEEEEALQKAFEAAYIQTGMRTMVDSYAKKLERQYVPEIVVRHGGVIMFLAETVMHEQIRIRFEWRFP